MAFFQILSGVGKGVHVRGYFSFLFPSNIWYTLLNWLILGSWEKNSHGNWEKNVTHNVWWTAGFAYAIECSPLNDPTVTEHCHLTRNPWRRAIQRKSVAAPRPSTLTPSEPCLSLYLLLPFSVGRNCDSLLAKRIWQKGWNITLWLDYVIWDSVLTVWVRDSPTGFEQWGIILWTAWIELYAIATCSREPRTALMIAQSYNLKDLNSAQKHMSLEGNPEFQKKYTQPGWYLNCSFVRCWAGDSVSHVQISPPHIINACSFRLLRLGSLVTQQS